MQIGSSHQMQNMLELAWVSFFSLSHHQVRCSTKPLNNTTSFQQPPPYLINLFSEALKFQIIRITCTSSYCSGHGPILNLRCTHASIATLHMHAHNFIIHA